MMSDYSGAKTDRESVIYFDHAATSWPKPPSVGAALNQYLEMGVGNPGRSGHRMSIAAAQLVEETRELVAELFGIADPSRITFTKNATEALNLALYGLLSPGDHVVVSSIEHNSVMRPLRHLESRGVELTVVNCAPDGTLNPVDVRQAIRPDTRLIATLHGSNVMGTLLPVAELSAIARDANIAYLVDASQTAGAMPIDVGKLAVDLFVFTGHKGLLGLTGTGGLYVREGLSLTPLIRGGTGSDSELEEQPEFMPDCFESGTLNVAGLTSLAAGVEYLLEIGVEKVQAHEKMLVERFLQGVAEIPGLVLYGPRDIEQRCSTIAFNISDVPCSEVGLLLLGHTEQLSPSPWFPCSSDLATVIPMSKSTWR
jgi:cysteine desulfurase family protein